MTATVVRITVKDKRYRATVRYLFYALYYSSGANILSTLPAIFLWSGRFLQSSAVT